VTIPFFSRISHRPAALIGAIVGLLLLVPGPRACAQSLLWNDISGRTGFSNIASLADGTLYGLYGSALYRSTDDGETWIAINKPGGTIHVLQAQGGTTLLVTRRFNVADYQQFFVSTDRGENWNRVYTEGAAGTVHANIMLTADETVYGLFPTGSRMGVEKFTNGFWQKVGNPPQVFYVSAAPPTYTVSEIDASGNFFIGTVSDGIHSSRDNGQTWSRALPYRYVSAIAFGPDDRAVIGTLPNGRTAGGVFVSDDHGASWELYDLTDVSIRDITIGAGGDIFVVADEGIYRRRAGAPEWETVGPFTISYSLIEITPSGKYLATAEGYGLLVSTDSGETWDTDGVRNEDLYSIASTQDGTILGGTLGRGYFRSTDRGGTWARQHGPGEPEYFYSLVPLEGSVYACTELGLFRTDDNGAGWTPLTTPLNNDSVNLPVYGVARSGGGDLYIGTGAGVWRSTDGGTSWSAAGIGPYLVRGLAVHGNQVWAATASEGVFLSTNGGSTWVGRGLVRPDLQTVAVNDAGVAYVGVAGGIFFSTNGGSSWTSKIFTGGHVYAFLFNGNFDTYAATSTGLFGTSDGGQSWGTRGLAGLFVIALAYDLNHGMLAAAYGDGVYRTLQVITDAAAPAPLPAGHRLSRNYPNPFNPVTTIAYDLAAPSEVILSVHDMLGRDVATLVSGTLPPGSYEAKWDASAFPSGVYLYRIRVAPQGSSRGPGASAPFEATGKMLLIR
jgi:photosystem II stability/assembly factor-like uncharacterized protein